MWVSVTVFVLIFVFHNVSSQLDGRSWEVQTPFTSLEIFCEAYAKMFKDALPGVQFEPVIGSKIVRIPIVQGNTMSASYAINVSLR